MVISSYAIHWIPLKEKLLTFQEVSKCLRSGGSFSFVVSTEIAGNFQSLVALLPEHICKEFQENLFYETGDSLKKIALENGFDEVSVKEVAFIAPLPPLNDFLKWLASSAHICEYQTLFECFRDIFKNNDVSFMYNENGDLEYRALDYFVTCKKH